MTLTIFNNDSGAVVARYANLIKCVFIGGGLVRVYYDKQIDNLITIDILLEHAEVC